MYTLNLTYNAQMKKHCVTIRDHKNKVIGMKFFSSESEARDWMNTHANKYARA